MFCVQALQKKTIKTIFMKVSKCGHFVISVDCDALPEAVNCHAHLKSMNIFLSGGVTGVWPVGELSVDN